MNLKMIMMTAVLMTTPLLGSMTASASAEVMTSSARDYETKWCRDVSFILSASRDAAYNAQTFEQEVVILKNGINKTLNIVNPKFAYYFESSLLLGLKIESVLQSPKDKALYLRRNIESALSDLHYFDSFTSDRYSQDHGNYTRELLERTLEEGMRAKTDQIEMLVLKAGIISSIQILAESDNRRDPSNACAVRYLKEALTFEDVNYKRDLVQFAINSIGYGCH